MVLRKLRIVYFSPFFLWGLVGIGILLHSAQYAFNRSLWVDEAALAVNLLDKSYQELFQPLALNQAAPIGFLFAEKFLTQLFGASEYVLRLIPFLSAILSLPLFLKVARHFLSPAAIPVALGLFVTSGRLIYHSSALKQYSSDVFVALFLYVILIEMFSQQPTAWRGLGVGMAGAIALWCSHPALFILIGGGVWFFLSCWQEKKWNTLRAFFFACLFWMLSFVSLYAISLRYAAENQYLQQFWAQEFMPFPPTSFADMMWFVSTFFTTLEYVLEIPRAFFEIISTLGNIFASITGIIPSLGRSLAEMISLVISGIFWITVYLIAAMMLLAGGVSYGIKDPQKLLLLISPVFLTLFASGLQKYPFGNRLILFLIPLLLIVIAAGSEWIWQKFRKTVPVIAVLMSGILLSYPAYFGVHGLIHPRKHEEARPVVRYLKEHKKEGDLIYVYYASQAVYQYYAKRFSLQNEKYVQGIESRADCRKYLHDLQQLRGHSRVWLFFSHAYSEEAFFLAYLDSIGKRLDEFKDVRASLYLYDLRFSLYDQ